MYDAELGAVSEALKRYRDTEEETTRTTEFKWHEWDELNNTINRVAGKEVGTEFALYKTDELFHHSETIRQVQDLYGKRMESIGYPHIVPESEGVSIHTFYAKILMLQKFAMALAPAEQQAAFAHIDDYVHRGKKAAGESCKRKIYGPAPADQYLGAWLSADEDVLIELDEMLESAKDVVKFRRRMGTLFSKKPQAAKLPGFALASASSSSTAPGVSAASSSKNKSKNKPKADGGGTSVAQPSGGAPKGAAPQPSKGGKQKAKGSPKAGSNKLAPGSLVAARRVFPLDDGSYQNGARGAAPPPPHASTRTLHQDKRTVRADHPTGRRPMTLWVRNT